MTGSELNRGVDDERLLWTAGITVMLRCSDHSSQQPRSTGPSIASTSSTGLRILAHIPLDPAVVHRAVPYGTVKPGP
eukprot:752658-Hanusia_phi.AAC.1